MIQRQELIIAPSCKKIAKHSSFGTAKLTYYADTEISRHVRSIKLSLNPPKSLLQYPHSSYNLSRFEMHRDITFSNSTRSGLSSPMSTPSSSRTGSVPYEPSLPYRLISGTIIGIVGTLCKAFLFGASRTEVHGLDKFLELLDRRRDPRRRERGLITGKLT